MSNDSIWVLVGIVAFALTFAAGFVVGVWKALGVFTKPEFVQALYEKFENKRRDG